MRRIYSIGIAAALMLAAVATWAATHPKAQPRMEAVGSLSPFDMMKAVRNLPVHIVTDAF